MWSWSQGIKAWSLLRASRGSASVRALSNVFQVKTKLFPLPLLPHSLVQFCATSAGCRRYLCSEEGRGWLTLQQVAWCQELWFVCKLLFGPRSSYGDLVSLLWAMHYRRGCVHLVLPEGRGGCLHCLCHKLLLTWEPVKHWLQTVARCPWLHLVPDECAQQLIINSFSPPLNLCKRRSPASTSHHWKRTFIMGSSWLFKNINLLSWDTP